MKKIFFALLILALPLLASAQAIDLTSNYSKIMAKRLAFGLNRNATLYNNLVEQSKSLTSEGQDLSIIDTKLAETKIIIDRGQTRLAELASTSPALVVSSTHSESYSSIKKTIKEIISDIRLSYVKIREIKLLIHPMEFSLYSTGLKKSRQTGQVNYNE